ncbi:MAG: toxin-antitoxin system HicB family antitoxin [Solirubrobacteraceae bacterium]
MTGQTITIIGSLFAALALQTVWITHSLGQLGGRITRMELHSDLAVEAARQGVSINTLVVAFLAAAIGWRAGEPR